MSQSELPPAVEAKVTESTKRRWGEYKELLRTFPQLSRIIPSLEEEVEVAKQGAWRPYNEYITSWTTLKVT